MPIQNTSFSYRFSICHIIRALVKIDISKNNFRAEGGKALAKALEGNQVIKQLMIANNEFCFEGDVSGVIAISNSIPTMGALVLADILNNSICTRHAHKLATVLKQHATLKSLCGNTGDETELDMSGKAIGADGTIMLAPEIIANGTLTWLNMSNSALCGLDRFDKGAYDASGVMALADALRKHQ